MEKIEKWFKDRKHKLNLLDKWFVDCFYYYSAFTTIMLIKHGGIGIVLFGWSIALIMLIGETAAEEMRKQWEQAKEKDKKGEDENGKDKE